MRARVQSKTAVLPAYRLAYSPSLLVDDSLKQCLAPDVTSRETIRSVVRHIDAALIEHWPASTALNSLLKGRAKR